MAMLARFSQANEDLTKQVNTLTNAIATLTSTTNRNHTDTLGRIDGIESRSRKANPGPPAPANGPLPPAMPNEQTPTEGNNSNNNGNKNTD